MTRRTRSPGPKRNLSRPGWLRQLGGSLSLATGDAIIRAAILLALLVPLYFNPLTQQSFEPDKAALLRTIVLLALAVWGILAIDRRLRDRRLREATQAHAEVGRASRGVIAFLRAPLVAPVLLLAATYLAATIGSIVPRLSLHGTHTRAQGLYTLAAYFALFFLVRRIRWTDRQVAVLVDTLVLASIPIAVYTILQRLGLDPLNFTTEGTPVTVRPISTLGNPIFLAAYMIMAMPLAGWRFYLSWTRRPDAVPSGAPSATPSARNGYNLWAPGAWGLILSLQVSAFVLAESRGPLLGLIAALAFAAFLGIGHARTRRPLVGAAIVMAGVVLVVVIAQSLPASGAASGPWGRLSRVADLSSRTARQRILTWQAATDALVAEPGRLWLGYGPATFREAVTAHMPAEMAQLKPDLDFDRAHNAVLDVWVNAGLVAVVAYLLVTGGILYYGLRLVGFAESELRRRLLLALMLGGSLVGGLAAWAGPGRDWIGVGLPAGLIAGAAVFMVAEAVAYSTERLGGRIEAPAAARNHTAPDFQAAPTLAVPLLIGLVAHTVETMVGMATVATSILFWLYAGIIASQAAQTDTTLTPGLPAPSDTSQAARKAARPAFPARSWGIITGVALALVSFPLLNNRYAPSPSPSLLLASVLASITMLLGIWLLTVERAGISTAVLTYLGNAAAVLAGFLLLQWLPWPPTDLSHTSVAVFVLVVLAVPAVGATAGGNATSRREPTRIARRLPATGTRLAAQLVYGLILIAALVTIWMTSVAPIRADVFYKEGIARTTAGDFVAARALLEKSIELEPEQDVYQSQLGVIFAQLAARAAESAGGDEAAQREEWLVRAEDHLQRAQQLDPYRADHLRNLGVLHHQVWAAGSPSPDALGDGAPRTASDHIKIALGYYARAADRNPIGVQTYRDWGQAYASLGDWNAAIERYEKSLGLNAGFPETWMLLGDAKLQIGDYDGAQEAYSRALALDAAYVRATYEAEVANSPDDPLTHQALALIYADAGETREALAEANTARELTPGESAAWDAFVALLQ